MMKIILLLVLLACVAAFAEKNIDLFGGREPEEQDGVLACIAKLDRNLKINSA
jgi:hypothetical protein